MYSKGFSGKRSYHNIIEDRHKDITLVATCTGIWFVLLLIFLGITSVEGSPSWLRLILFALTCSHIGLLVGFIASIPPSLKNEKIDELESGLVSETGKWMSSAIAGGSITAIIIKGKQFLFWISDDMGQPKSLVLLVAILFLILGFIMMYFTRRIILNVVMADSRKRLEVIFRDINMINDWWRGKAFGDTSGEVPDEINEAVERLKSVSEERPFEKFEGLLAQGIAMKLKGNLVSAAQYLERAVDANPSDYRALATLASVLSENGDAERAYHYMSKAESLRTKDTDPDYFKVFAQISYAAKKYEQAIEFYLRFLRLHPNDSETRYSLAKAYAILGHINGDPETKEKSKQALKIAIERNPNLKPEIINDIQENDVFDDFKQDEEFKELIEI